MPKRGIQEISRPETRLVRLVSRQTTDIGLALVERMKRDRPHMAAKLSKLLPYLPGDSTQRLWHPGVESGTTQVWGLRVQSTEEYVGVLWADVQKRQKSNSPKRQAPNLELVGAIEVLWVAPEYRSFGYGSLIVQSVILRCPEIETWTAFASQGVRDVGLHTFWRKNGFTESAQEVGRTTLDGFFVRTAATAERCMRAKRRPATSTVLDSPPRWSAREILCTLPESVREEYDALIAISKSGVFGDERNCAGGCFCPPGEDELWAKAVPGVVENLKPKKTFTAEFKWWRGLFSGKPKLEDRNGKVYAGSDFFAKTDQEPDLQVLAGFRLGFWSDNDAALEKTDTHGVVAAQGSKYKMILLGGEAAKIRDLEEAGFQGKANVSFELVGLWVPNREAQEKRLLLIYLALQRAGVAIKIGEELLSDPPL